MVAKEIQIHHAEGVHTRPASIFVREAAKFSSEITLSSGGTSVNGKSIMGLLMLALGPGDTVELQANGNDENEAVQRLGEILSGSFK